MELTAELEGFGGNTAGFTIAAEVVDDLGGGKRPKVVVTLNGHTWRSSIAPMGGCYVLGVSMANRKAAGASAGETYVVDLVLDTAPRTITPPEDLVVALMDAGGMDAWAKLSYSHQREHVMAIEEAKRPETRVRRIAKCVGMLSG